MVIAESAPNLIQLNNRPPENGCRPSVDALFRSAKFWGAKDVQLVILTGMGNDGAKELLALKNLGAGVVAQDEKSSVVWGMPSAAFATGAVDDLVSLSDMANYLAERVH